MDESINQIKSLKQKFVEEIMPLETPREIKK